MTERSKEQVAESVQLVYELGKADGVIEAVTHLREMAISLVDAISEIQTGWTNKRESIKAALDSRKVQEPPKDVA